MVYGLPGCKRFVRFGLPAADPHLSLDGPDADGPLLPFRSCRRDSYIRILGLGGKAYHRFLHLFHSQGSIWIGSPIAGSGCAWCCFSLCWPVPAWSVLPTVSKPLRG